MLQVVNGYICTSGCDVEAARRGADPRNPTRDPVKQELLDRANPAKVARENQHTARAGSTGEGQSTLEPSGALPAGLGRLLDIRV
jgi:hypothetical protein